MRTKVIIAIVAGVTFGLTVLSGLGVWRWYQMRPTPWNTEAVKAKFWKLDADEVDGRLKFYYVLENKTAVDYHIGEVSQVRLVARVGPESAVHSSEGFPKFSPTPFFLPAGQKSFVVVDLGESYKLEEPYKKDGKDEDRKARSEAATKYARERMPNLYGFSIFDERHRYQIDLPKEW